MPPVASLSTIPSHADRVAILVNPKAGPKAAAMPWAEGLAKQLQGHGFVTELFTNLAEATRQANRWFEEGCLRTLVGAGGDGTAAELVNRTVEGLPITLLPAGNSNLLARYFHLSPDSETLCRTVVEGTVARIDAGRANGRIFLLMAGCGFDAEVVRRVHEHRTGHISLTTYLKPVAKAICRYDFPEIRVDWQQEGQPARTAVRWAFAFNLPCYGGGFHIAPQSDGSDGLLDLCTMRRGRLGPGLWYAASVMLRRHQRMADWMTCRTDRMTLTSDAEVPYQLDGDPGGVLPLEIESLPGRMALVVPKEFVEVRTASDKDPSPKT